MGAYAISQRDNTQAMQQQTNMAVQNAYLDAEGNWQRVANIRNIGQRGVIRQGEQWVDSRLRIAAPEQQKPELQVQAFSEAHFQLSRSFPQLNGVLSTSDNMLLLVNGHVVQVGEEGKTVLGEEDLKLLAAPAAGGVGAAPTEGETEIAGLSTAPRAARMAGLALMLVFAGVLTARRRR